MTRVGSFAQSRILTGELMRLNQQQFRTQEQISSGKVASQFAKMPDDASVLLSARGVEARIDHYTKTATETKARLDMQDLHLDTLTSIGTDLRQAVTEAVANDNGLVVMQELEQAFTASVSLLNSKIDGNYIYGGTRTDRPPVTSDDLADLIGAADASDLFANNDLKATVRIDDTLNVEMGVLADDVAADLFAAMKRIAEFNAGPNGPIGEDLTPNQKAFLESELPALRAAVSTVTAEQARNGLNYREVERTLTRHEAGDVFIKSFISDIEDVDLAEAISRLNNDRVAVEASTRVLADLNRLSLLDFI